MNWSYYAVYSKIHFIPHERLKLGPTFNPCSAFFSLNNTMNILYANVPEMFSYNPKTSVQKYPNFYNWYNAFSANVSDFYTYFAIEN